MNFAQLLKKLNPNTKSNASGVRTRFAPSPTGYLHIGSLRTALYAYLIARHNNGSFSLRIEDTDQKRLVEGATEALIKILEDMGLNYDEGPRIRDGKVVDDGPVGPYIQSKRLDIYKKYAQKLIEDGKAYYCFVSEEALDEIRKKALAENRPIKQADLNEGFTAEEVNTKIAQGEKYVIRAKTPDSGQIKFTDLVKGEVIFDYATVDDFVIMKSDGFPTYHLASIVDDGLMNFTYVIRGDEWLSSVPRHLFLYECLGFPVPAFAHLPLILNADKSKLSKRQGDVAVEDYLAKGYLPEALINFVAMLGWNPGEGSTEEIFSLEKLVEIFDIAKVNKAGAVFDLTKLNWLNGKYLREQITLEKFIELADKYFRPYLHESKIGADILNDIFKLQLFAKICREHVDYLAQIDEFLKQNSWTADKIDYDPKLLTWKKSTPEDAREKISLLKTYLESLDSSKFNLTDLETEIKGWITQNDFQTGNVLWPMRVALTGLDKSPNPFEIAALLGKEETLKRLENAIDISK